MVAADRSEIRESGRSRSLLSKLHRPGYQSIGHGPRGRRNLRICVPWRPPELAITISDYYNLPLRYARAVANSGGSAMLFNKRRFSRALCAFFSGGGRHSGTRRVAVLTFAAVPGQQQISE